MTSSEHGTVKSADELVMRTQELADLYVRCIDENPGASVEFPAQGEQLEDLLQALARFVMASDRAVANIARFFSGEYDPAYAARTAGPAGGDELDDIQADF